MSTLPLGPYMARGGDLALRYARYSPQLANYRMAYRVGSTAYKHRKEAAAAARTIKRAYKRWQRRSKERPVEKIGEKPGTGNVQRSNVGNISVQDRTSQNLYFQDVTDILGTSGTAAPNIDERRRALVHLRGIKVCMEWQNTLAKDILCNIAVVAPRSSTTVSTTDFFRGNGSQRGLNFDYLTINSLDMHCRPINTDLYTVLRHERFTIGKAFTGSMPPDYRYVEFYQKIDRQIRFDDEHGGTAKTPIYLCYWYTPVNTDAGVAQSSTGVKMTYDTLAFFTDTCVC